MAGLSWALPLLSQQAARGRAARDPRVPSPPTTRTRPASCIEQKHRQPGGGSICLPVSSASRACRDMGGIEDARLAFRRTKSTQKLNNICQTRGGAPLATALTAPTAPAARKSMPLLAWYVTENAGARSCWLDGRCGNWFVVLQHRARCILSGSTAARLDFATSLVSLGKTLLAFGANRVVLAEFATTALLAGGANDVVRAVGATIALLAPGANDVVRAVGATISCAHTNLRIHAGCRAGWRRLLRCEWSERWRYVRWCFKTL